MESIVLAEKALSIVGTLSAVDKNLELVTTTIHGVSVSWVSSSSAISNTGVVIRPSFTDGNNPDITLTATLIKGSETRTKVFENITVLKLPISDVESVANVKKTLTLANTDALQSNLTLPTLIDGVTLTWSSIDSSVISNSGVIFPDNYQGSDKVGTLTVIFTKGSVTDTKTYTVTVLKALITDEESVDLVLPQLSVLESNKVDGNFLSNITLPTTGNNDVSIVWNSSELSLVTVDGSISKAPLSSGGFVDVKLIARVSKNNISKTKEFTIRIFINPTDEEAVSFEQEAFTLTTEAYDNITNPELFDMPTTTSYLGVEVAYSSSNTAVFTPSDNGDKPTVNPQSFTDGDADVSVVATFSLNDVVMSKEFNLTIKSLAISDQEAVNTQTVNLTLGDTSSLREDLNLPTSINGVTVVWSSSDETVINNSGKIFPSDFDGIDKTAILTATLTLGAVTTTKNFTVTVLKLMLTDGQKVALDKEALTLGNVSSVTNDLTLPISGSQGSTISWSSIDTDVISNTGVVTQPSATIGSKDIKLIATVSQGSISDTKEFIVRVLALAQTDAEAVALSKKDLNIPASFDAILEDVTFPSDAHDSGVALSWESNNTNVLSNIGVVLSEPSFLEGDIKVLLTVTFTRNYDLGATDTKSFIVTVKALAMTDAEAISLAKLDLTLGDTSSVTENLTLPTTGLHETTITYSSNNTNVLSNTGVVTRPSFGDGDVTVVLTATIFKNGVSDTKSFTVVVKQKELNLPGV